MESRYDAQKYEQEIYLKWESSGAFQPKCEGSDPSHHDQTFTIIMPPPNANDPLHVGHAMFVTIEDIMIRYQRMRGKATLWLPGTDHAGIETQFVFEKKLNKEGKSRFDFDRETLYQMIWDYVQKNSGVAVGQMKRLGASADWSRLAFTLDPDIVDQVIDTFKKLHDDELVYRDLRLVNYCTRCGTSFSNLEVKDAVRKDPFIYMRYNVTKAKGQRLRDKGIPKEFIIGTVRPETKFRDTALAVNPKDLRYKKYIGKSYDIMGLLGSISMTVVADPEVDPNFGTGIMKVTPAHDFHDFDLGKKYNLPITSIISTDGKMDFSWFLENPSHPKKYLDRAKRYHGTHVSKVRRMMINDLKEDGLLVKIDEAYEHSVGTCYKCGTVLEPLPLPQFFVRTKPLAEKVLDALRKKLVRVVGAGHDKILRHWLTNIQDWNVSRQIVWGIRIPVWYCTRSAHSLGPRPSALGLGGERPPLGTHYVISKEKPDTCTECDEKEFIQETDTFDTWFSSGQWPVVTLRRHHKDEGQRMKDKGESIEIPSTFSLQPSALAESPKDFQLFYPTDVMETAYEILFFWVARMLMLGLYLTGKVPFHTVYLHGLIRDEKGQKMSKSKGNVINPLTIVEKYGADALRMALVIRSTPGLDKATGEGDIRAMRNLTNKIWNASRYVAMQTASETPKGLALRPQGQALQDEKFIKKLYSVVKTVTKQLDDYRIGLAAETVYNEFWHWFCDEAIEESKRGKINNASLFHGLVVFLKLLHPFVPFVTEAVWEEIKPLRKYPDRLLISSPWPIESSQPS